MELYKTVTSKLLDTIDLYKSIIHTNILEEIFYIDSQIDFFVTGNSLYILFIFIKLKTR